MSKSDVGDVSMIMTPGVALQGGKPRIIYFSSLHLTTWTDHAGPKTWFILALYRTTTSSAGLLKSQRLRGIFWRDSCAFSKPVWIVQPCKQSSTTSHIQDTSRLLRLSRTCECPWSPYWILLASYTIGHCLDPKDRAGKWEKMNSAEYWTLDANQRPSDYLSWISWIGRAA